jgi:hypothetical protein
LRNIRNIRQVSRVSLSPRDGRSVAETRRAGTLFPSDKRASRRVFPQNRRPAGFSQIHHLWESGTCKSSGRGPPSSGFATPRASRIGLYFVAAPCRVGVPDLRLRPPHTLATGPSRDLRRAQRRLPFARCRALVSACRQPGSGDAWLTARGPARAGRVMTGVSCVTTGMALEKVRSLIELTERQPRWVAA